MGKHSKGGILGGGDRGPSRENRIPAERVLSTENHKPLEDAPRRAGIESAPARLRAERDRRRSKTKRILLSILGVFVFLVAAGAVALFAWASSMQDRMQGGVTVEQKEQLNLVINKAEPGKPFNILLMGADFREGDPSIRTDTMIVARIDPQAKRVWMLSIPRDTKVLIPGHGYGKINSAYTYGGSALAVKTVKGFTGLPINNYMEVNFAGFTNAVNQMGGVWINVPKAINDKRAAGQSVHQRAYKIPAGWQKLDGEHALTFVRSRSGFADQDFSRMSDQQIFFRAVADQLAHRTDVPTMIKVVNGITPYIKTDMSIMDLLKTALTMKDAGAKNMYTATVGGEWISPYIIPDEDKLHRLVKNFKDEVPFEKSANIATEVNPGATTSVATTKTAAPKTTTVGSVKPSSIKITVRNGAGVSGYGAQAASILKAKGFKVKSVGNANQSVYKTTLVVYKKDLAGAKAVAGVLIPGAKIVKNRGLYSSPTEILVVVGKDWDLSKIPAASVTTQ
jgi:polyisoprenyl-teichoic acid--peptidoglycan teichoic acid transferase